ncbi:hypothetical protein L210DRAFT_3172041 [Boletus edulis BED1]|uniref:Uncharacterized protein n=1 Tax=Boletus edulis BED1 TaxID=1328754 RepID=A0AAD4GH19_BOLED|nr:hypothetical protein L210DRAFT_3172041 [Boletus edulis BED1]
MDPLDLPPAMDWSPQYCFCGSPTVDLHEHWYCSTKCARLDALQSLDSPECHYRRVVQARAQACAPDPDPDCIMSVDHLPPSPSEQRGFVNAPPPFIPPTHLPHQGNATFMQQSAGGRNMAGFPTLSQVMGKVLIKKATAGEPLVAERHDRPRWQGFPNERSRARPVQTPGDHALKKISLDAIPLPDPTPKPAPAPSRTLRRVPTFSSLSNKFRKGRESGNAEKIFGHPVNHIIPPVRKDSLPSHRQMNPSTTVPVPNPKAVRRSASFSGVNAKARSDREPSKAQDSLMHIVEEMREDMSESFDPRSLFAQEEDY